ncbi:hypothetical protein QQ045_024446 [Rhodiola kirilowii]
MTIRNRRSTVDWLGLSTGFIRSRIAPLRYDWTYFDNDATRSRRRSTADGSEPTVSATAAALDVGTTSTDVEPAAADSSATSVPTASATAAAVVNVKLIRNKQTSQLEGYGFIEFASRSAAERVLQTVNGTLMPNAEQNFRLNWASFSAGERRSDDTAEYTIFVGDLAPDVSDYLLQETFRQHYPSIKGAKVVTDKMTGRTKGYGFVKFGDESEQQRAMTEMNGQLCSSRPMRIGAAAKQNTPVGQQFPKVSYQSNQGIQNENDPNNTTIFVGGLDPNVSDDYLKQHFGQFGEIVHVKIPVGKRCGFVQFTDRSSAEQALQMLNGTQLGGQSIRLSWGHTPSNRQNPSAGAAQPQSGLNGWNNGHYGYGNGYEAYGYAPAAPQDPNMYYAGGYGGYGNYQQPPQQQCLANDIILSLCTKK